MSTLSIATLARENLRLLEAVPATGGTVMEIWRRSECRWSRLTIGRRLRALSKTGSLIQTMKHQPNTGLPIAIYRRVVK